MKNKVTILAVLLIVSHILTETHSFLLAMFPQASDMEVDLFLSPAFEMKINVLWYTKFIFDNLLTIVVFFVLAEMAKDVSKKFFYVAVIYVAYHIADFLSFLWNFKQTYEIYWILLVCTTVAIIIMIKNGNGKVVPFNNNSDHPQRI